MSVLTTALPFSTQLLPKRGEYNGQCFHATCERTGADWINRQDQRYYCDAHARSINEHCLREGLTKLCSLHL